MPMRSSCILLIPLLWKRPLRERELFIPHSSLPVSFQGITEFVGAALQACLDGRVLSNPYHNVFTVGQAFFQNRDWVIVSPEHMAIEERLGQLPRLSDYISVVQGFVSGADDVFILPRSKIPAGEEGVYLNYLPDKEILRYRLPSRVEQVVFYPFEDDVALTADDLAEKYPGTWRYLNDNREKLSARGPVRAGKTFWWRPERPREPTVIRRPKIVSPHLMLTPRFALDLKGQFAVSRSPFMVAQDEGERETLLKFFCAVLNSSVCNWHIRTYASKYSHGYNRLESNLLKAVPVPDVALISVSDFNRVVALVDKLSGAKSNSGTLDVELDSLIADLYGFTSSERKILLGLG
jgi:hypothetical protein